MMARASLRFESLIAYGIIPATSEDSRRSADLKVMEHILGTVPSFDTVAGESVDHKRSAYQDLEGMGRNKKDSGISLRRSFVV